MARAFSPNFGVRRDCRVVSFDNHANHYYIFQSVSGLCQDFPSLCSFDFFVLADIYDICEYELCFVTYFS